MFFCHNKETIKSEDVWQHGTEDNIRTQERESNKLMENITLLN